MPLKRVKLPLVRTTLLQIGTSSNKKSEDNETSSSSSSTETTTTAPTPQNEERSSLLDKNAVELKEVTTDKKSNDKTADFDAAEDAALSKYRKATLLSIAYSASVGGTATVIGTGINEM